MIEESLDLDSVVKSFEQPPPKLNHNDSNFMDHAPMVLPVENKSEDKIQPPALPNAFTEALNHAPSTLPNNPFVV